MNSDIHFHLIHLHKCLPDNSRPDLASTHAGDIVRCCSYLNTDTELASACSLIFDGNNGLLTYLRKCAALDQFNASKSKILEFLPTFIEKSKKSIVKYAVDIKNVCLLIFNCDKKVKIRVFVFSILMKLFEHCAGNEVGRELDTPGLVDILFLNLAQQSKLAPTVKQGIYRLLGTLIETFPEHFGKYADRILIVYFSELKRQMTSKTKSPDMQIIAGCFGGMISLLNAFSRPLEEDECKQIFQYANMAIKYNEDYSRYDIPKSGLQLIGKHASLFSKYLYENHDVVYSNLCLWLKSGNRDMNKLTYLALEAFFRQIAATFCSEIAAGNNGALVESKFRYFVDKFNWIINTYNENSNLRLIAVAIKGYGFFAAPCKLLLNKSEVKIMFIEVLKHCEIVFFSNTDGIENKIQYLPSFVESLASIISQLDEISAVFLVSLENLLIYLIEHFPLLLPVHHFLCYHSIIKLLINIYPKGEAFKPFVSKIVYHGLLRTCSHAVILEADHEDAAVKENTSWDQQDPRNISYKNYMELWKHLLDAVQQKDLNDLGIPLAERQAVTEILYDEIIASVLNIISKLNFSATKSGEIKIEQDPSSPTSDPIAGLHASNPKDFQIFINVVEFCKSLLLDQNTSLFKKWIYKFGYEIILLSTKFPIVSGFYKLLAICFKMAARSRYFAGIDALDKNHVEMEKSTKYKFNERTTCYILFFKYMKEVITRLQQYKEDLLASCLQLILSLPAEIVSKAIPVITPTVGSAFRLGPSYIPIAQEALLALEMWSSELPVDVIAPLYVEILPLLNTYLKTTTSVDKLNIVNIIPTKTSSKRTFNKSAVRLYRGGIDTSDSVPRILQLKLRIVELLGHLGSSVNQHLVCGPELTFAKSGISWDSNKHMKFSVPFADMKPVLYLDSFLPKVVDLALFSSDRQTKAAACELLHALVLFVLGSSTSKSLEMQQKQPLTSLYKRILPALLQLACDVDSFVRQLFEPLVMQMIHWFSGKQTLNSEATEVFLETLMDGVGSPFDSALRDFSAKCLKEFSVWSIKQAVSKKSRQDNKHVKMLLKALYGLSLNPNAFLRLGAALTFNSIFTVFREEDELVNVYIFELLYYFIESLSIAQKDDKHLGTREQCKEALDHIQRILIHKSSTLKVKDASRRIPAKCSAVDLETAVIWLLEQCGRPETDCRHYCMSLVTKLIPCLKDSPTTQEYFQQILKDKGPEFFISKFEGLGRPQNERQYLHTSPDLRKYLSHGFSISSILSWFDIFIAALDCYIWSFGNKDLQPSYVFQENSASVLLHSVKCFLSDVALADLSSLASSFLPKTNLTTVVFSPGEINQFNYGKCTAIIRIMDFVECIARIGFNSIRVKAFMEDIFQNSFWFMYAHCVLCPLSIGFEVADLEIMENLPLRTSSTLSTLKRCLSDELLQKLPSIVGRKMLELDTWNAFRQLTSISDYDFASSTVLSHLLGGYVQLHHNGMLVPSLLAAKMDNVADLALRLLDAARSTCTRNTSGTLYALRLTGPQLILAQALLNLSFGLGLTDSILIPYLMDETSLKSPNGHSTISMGGHLLVTFEQEIILCLIRAAPHSLHRLMIWASKRSLTLANILFGMLEQLATDRSLRKSFGTEVTNAILANWEKVEFWWQAGSPEEMKKLCLRLLTKLLIIDSTITSSQSNENASFIRVFDMYLALIVDKKLNLQMKGQVLDILPFFLSINQDHLKQLRGHLVKLFAQHFPLKSSELALGSLKYQEYVTMFKKLLTALRQSGSLILLEILSELVCTEPRHVCEDDFASALVSFIKRLPNESHVAAICIPMEIFWNESVSSDVRRWALERIAIPLLQHSNKVALLEFFTLNINRIMSNIQEKVYKGFSDRLSSQLVTKLGCFKLLEVLYNCCSVHDLHSMQSKVNAAFCHGNPRTGKELTQEITRAGHGAKKENVGDETALLELRRQYRCSAYNALVAVISCTQTEIKFYTGFLFSENLSKGEFLWDNLIDNTKTYTFEVELNTHFEKRKQMVNIRKVSREAKIGPHAEFEGDSYDLSIHLLTTQNLEGSSLGESVSQFDFTSSSRIISSLVDQNRSVAEEDEKEVKPVLQANYVELELDELNRHECMAALNGVLDHLTAVVTKSNPIVADEMPTWMASLHKKMIDSNTQRNIRLFIAKLVVNNENIFKPFAKHWLYPLMQLIVTGCVGNGINYFVSDILVVILSWHEVAKPEDTVTERSMVTRLLEFLMQNARHQTNEILRHNLELIKTVIECWKERLEISTKIIYSHLCDNNPEKLDNVVGIQLLGVVVSNDLPPYSPMTTGLSEEEFLKTFAQNLNFKYKLVYQSTAEVAGICLKYLSKKANSHEFPFHALVKNLLSKMALSQLDRFIYCLHSIRLNYPPIVDNFWKKLLFVLNQLHGVMVILALEIIFARLESIPDVFLELKSIDFYSILKNGNENVQTLCLQIFNKMLHLMNVEQVLEMLPVILPFAMQPGNQKGRKTTLDILIWVYDNLKGEATESVSKAMTSAKSALIHCLADEDLEIRLKALNFWSHESRMPTTTLERATELLKNLYSPSNEHDFLGYATYLLLELTSKSPDFNRTIFEHPLSDCKFEDYNINASWRAQHSTMIPLFAESLSSGSHADSNGGTGSPDEHSGKIRATQDHLEFTPTQDQSKPYNWLTQSTFEAPLSTLGTDDGDSVTSSLMFNRKSGIRAKWRKPTGPNFGRNKLNVDETDHSVADARATRSDLLRLRRRFLKDRSQQSSFFARRNAKLNVAREVLLQEQKLAREMQVTQYRNYRKGDLPDIQISYASIIAPLQALAQRDATVAKMLFSFLFTGILAEASQLKEANDFDSIICSTLTSLNAILKNTNVYYPSLISAIQEICFNSDKLKPNIDDLTLASQMSFQQNMGILLLERAVMEEALQDGPRPSKMAKLQKPKSTDEKKQIWIKLAELNKSLHLHDVVNGIFMHKVATELELQRALEAEAQGDFYAALKNYQTAFAVETQRQDATMLDADLWNDCTLHCFEQLNNWEKLSSVALSNFDDDPRPDINNVWEDINYQEMYLPYIVRGKLKLILKGSNEQAFVNFLDTALSDVEHPERRQFLEGHFSEELALLSIVQKDYDRADHYRSSCIRSFLEDWSCFSDLIPVHQRTRLYSLQKLVEMGDFLNVIKETGMLIESKLAKLFARWEKSHTDKFTDVNVLNDIYVNRNLYINHIEARLAQLSMFAKHDIRDELKKRGYRNQLSLVMTCVEAAGCQNNVTVALAHLKDSYKFLEKLNEPILKSKWYHTYCRTHQLNAKKQNGGKMITTLWNVWKNLDKDIISEATKDCANLKMENLWLQCKNGEMLLEFLNEKENDPLNQFTSEQLRELQRRIGCSSSDLKQLKEGLTEYCFGKLKASVEIVNKSKCDPSLSAEAYLRLAKFCDGHGRLAEKTSDVRPIMEFAAATVDNLLDAQKSGSEEAARLFPRLLQLIETHPEMEDRFIAKISTIPCWMFLPWTAQLVALLDKPQASAIHELVLRIANEYPNALIYPLNVSMKGYNFTNGGKLNKRNKLFVQKLQDVLSKLWLVEQFTLALEEFTNPFATYKDTVKEMTQVLGADKSQCKKLYGELYHKLFVEPFDDSGPVSHGPFRKTFAKVTQKVFDEHFGKNGSKLDKMDANNFNIASQTIVTFVESKARKELKHPTLLKDYTNWLSEFQQSSYSMDLEIPGQYGKFKKPMPEQHTKIARFHPNVLNLSSLRQPKRIVIYGDDNKEYKFLVKTGEDLRGDQRIEQLFGIMNEIFWSDPQCRSRQLKMVTYEIVPLSDSLGLLEWVPNAEPLKDFMEGSMTDDDKKDMIRTDKAVFQWIEQICGKKNLGPGAIYEKIHMTCKRQESVSKFREIVLLTPRNALKNAFFKLSASTEAFFTLRNHFVVSYAVACICQYILGVGDRHLSNFMVSRETGSIVTIDFGYCFGSATSFLGVPELMPMRLSPQLLNLMEPMRQHGLFERTMIHALNALRNNTGILINTMDVFINEPSLDWVKLARLQFNVAGKQGDENDMDWYPRQRVEFVKRKLNGDNCAAVMLDELNLGQRKKKAFACFNKVCAGEKGINIRADCPDKHLTVEKQVQCLVDHAMDEHVLAKTYFGWKPYI